VPDDPYIDPVSGVLRNKLRPNTAEELAAAEREITHAALILIRESPVRATYDLPHLCAIHQLNWQHLDAARNIEASASIMHGDAEPMRKMLDPLLTDGT
jgi:hypothetical protein